MLALWKQPVQARSVILCKWCISKLSVRVIDGLVKEHFSQFRVDLRKCLVLLGGFTVPSRSLGKNMDVVMYA